MNTETSATQSRVIAGSVLIALLVCVGANALLYTVKAGSPLIGADDWVFVDWIVRKAAEGHLTIGDLFIKRGLFDHSQPLRKLILLFHYRYFDLDFGIAALIGVMTSFANLGMLWLLVRHGCDRPSRPTALAMAAFGAMSAIYLSLNAPVIFNWSLLTLAYTSHAFILVFLISAWWAYRDPRPWPLVAMFASAFAMDVVADGIGLITTTAALLTLAIFGVRQRRLAASARACVAMFVAYAGYALFRASITVENIASTDFNEATLATRLGRLLGNLGNDISGLGIPLIAPVVHRMQLQWMLGDHAIAAEVAILIVMLAFHGWFWWQAWCGRRNAAAFVAVSLMLMFYGTVAAILVVRISLAHPGYFWKARYVVTYAWNIVALLLMAISQLSRADETEQCPSQLAPRLRHAGRGVLLLSVVALLGIQIPMSIHSWQTVKYHSVWIQRRAVWMDELAVKKGTDGPPCAAGTVNCGDFVNVAHFMRRHRLSVFSQAFRSRNRLYPNARSLPQ